MHARRRLSAWLILSLLVSSSFTATVTAQRRRSSQASATVIFKVLKTEGGGYMEPVVIINRGRYQAPPYVEPQADQFNKTYFRAGQSYRLLFGGAEAGSAVVEKPAELGCAETGAADVRLQFSINTDEALATNNATWGRRERVRRDVNERERKAALDFARNVFRRKGVPAALVRIMQASKLVATDLNLDGKAELIGDFQITKNEQEGMPDYTLLLVLEPQGAGFRAGLSRYYHNRQKYTQAAGVQDETFMDHLDLDGDRMDEIIVRKGVWEGWYYTIYKKRGRVWRSVYEGGGGGC